MSFTINPPATYAGLASAREGLVKSSELTVPALEGTAASGLFVMLADFGASSNNVDNSDSEGGSGVAGPGSSEVPDPNWVQIAKLFRTWNPDYVVGIGDLYYPRDTTQTWKTLDLDSVVGPYLRDYIQAGRFIGGLGNHDRDPSGNLAIALAYFRIPQPYYSKRMGDVHWFVVDSGYDNNQVNQQADGVTPSSIQAQAVLAAIRASDARFKIVALHHPPYTSCFSSFFGNHLLEYVNLRWDFAGAGADLVIFGHAHQYERLLGPDDVTYICVGGGGHSLAAFREPPTPNATSVIRYNSKNTVSRGRVGPAGLIIETFNQLGFVVDSFMLPG
jgi:tartrate-resistant acid phosphatase type 5